MVTNLNDPPAPGESATPPRSTSKKVRKKKSPSAAAQNGSGSAFDPPKTTLVYNEYGELVDFEKVKRPHTSADLSVTDTLRLIRKAYHHEVSSTKKISEHVMQCLANDVIYV